MKLTVLGSGSTGNAVLIVAGNTRVLVDAGLSAKEIVRRLAVVGEDAQQLDGVLVTHEHGDHAGGLRVLLGSVDCPVYISAKTLDAYVSERFNVNTEEPRRRAKALRDRVEQIVSRAFICRDRCRRLSGPRCDPQHLPRLACCCIERFRASQPLPQVTKLRKHRHTTEYLVRVKVIERSELERQNRPVLKIQFHARLQPRDHFIKIVPVDLYRYST